jgi:hypothetical protein
MLADIDRFNRITTGADRGWRQPYCSRWATLLRREIFSDEVS